MTARYGPIAAALAAIVDAAYGLRTWWVEGQEGTPLDAAAFLGGVALITVVEVSAILLVLRMFGVV